MSSWHRTAAIVIPMAVCVAASAWLYGFPGKNQRYSTSSTRRRAVLGAAGFCAALAVIGFFTRASWEPAVGQELAISVFLGAVLLVVVLLFAALPPQKDL